MNQHDVYVKVSNTIGSCTNKTQLAAAEVLVGLFDMFYPSTVSGDTARLRYRLQDKRMALTDKEILTS